MAFGNFLAGAALGGIPIVGPGLAAMQWAKMGKKRNAPPAIHKGEKTIAATDKSSGRGAALSLAGLATDAELEAQQQWTQRELDADEVRLDAIEAQLAMMQQPRPQGGAFGGGGGGGGFGGIGMLLLLSGGLFGGTTSTIDPTTLILLMAMGGGGF